MGRTFLALSILAATLPLFAQKPASAPNKPEGQVAASCTVSGRVVTAAEASPLKAARVALTREQATVISQSRMSLPDATIVLLLEQAMLINLISPTEPTAVPCSPFNRGNS
ncbi:MAG: hypothetical protein DMG84_08540 [Acidobacteria bacterium]|nr:MAG: hypothetical protein DMG84_08540 [Acidobacteriota bacterium]